MITQKKENERNNFCPSQTLESARNQCNPKRQIKLPEVCVLFLELAKVHVNHMRCLILGSSLSSICRVSTSLFQALR